MELLTASTLRARHGFPLRTGGFSVGPFASLNSSLVVGDDPVAVGRNLALLAQAAGVDPSRLVTAKQVHGDRVVLAAEVDATTEADAVWTAERGVAVGVRTADCLPILLEDPRTGAVAAVHAGWRGVISEIVVRAVERLEAQGARVGDLRVAVGPGIQACCFEVDGDLPQRFSAAFGTDVVIPTGARVHLDLPRAVRRSLERHGVPQSHVAVLPHCTRCDERFFSHRRDRGVTGRHLSFITCGGAADL
ncbi:MAG: peptidoglycan editing factor PgeF [Myxococcota bacterium]